MPSFTTKEARTPEEIQQSRDIRFAVFIDEQVRPDSRAHHVQVQGEATRTSAQAA